MEKILDPGEQLRDWPVDGTVGYEFLNDAAALFVDPAGEEPSDRAVGRALRRRPAASATYAVEAKLEQARTTFAAEVRTAPRARLARDDLPEALSSLPVYRTYVRGAGQAPPRGSARSVRRGGHRVAARRAGREFVTRFQQTTPPVMAKGVEDTAFYRYLRLLALNDVGGDPGRFGSRSSSFHAANAARRAAQPARHPDARHQALRRRARADRRAGRAWPRSGQAHVRGWLDAMLATVPRARRGRALPHLPDARRRVADRARAARRATSRRRCARPSARRAGSTPDEEHEAAVKAFARGLLDLPEFRADFDPFLAEVAAAGERAALGQLLLKLTVPGLPDIYQGDELLLLSLVDPDNRRPVDWDARREALAALRRGEDTRPEAAADRARARAARAAAGRVLRRLHAGRARASDVVRVRARRGRGARRGAGALAARARRSRCRASSPARGATC